MILVKTLKNLRKKTGWTTQELADKVNVSKRTVEGWECGRSIDPFKVLKIADLCEKEGIANDVIKIN